MLAIDPAKQTARAVAPESIQPEVQDLTALSAADGSLSERAYQTGTIISGIVISAALLIGIFVIAQVGGSLDFTSLVADPGNSSLLAAKNSTVGRLGDAFLLGSVVVIVLFAAVILRVLRGL